MMLTQQIKIDEDSNSMSVEEMKKRVRDAWKKEKRSYDIYVKLCKDGSVGSRYSWLMMAHETLIREMTLKTLMVDLGITENEVDAL
ncbi:MAG: hypothetical protein IJ899_02665 [Blautia sp.]|nr:hypothetical protein [Blautia sp.]